MLRIGVEHFNELPPPPIGSIDSLKRLDSAPRSVVRRPCHTSHTLHSTTARPVLPIHLAYVTALVFPCPTLPLSLPSAMSVLNAAVADLATSAAQAAAEVATPDTTEISKSLIAVIGLALVAAGTRFLFNPAAAQQEFGLAHNTSDPPAPQPLTLYTGLMGLRDLVVGLVLLVLGQLVSAEVVGWAVLGVIVLPVMDAFLAVRHKAESAKVVSHLGTAGGVLTAGLHAYQQGSVRGRAEKGMLPGVYLFVCSMDRVM